MAQMVKSASFDFRRLGHNDRNSIDQCDTRLCGSRYRRRHVGVFQRIGLGRRHMTSLNDAPVLDNTGLMDLPNVLKNSTDPSGSLVSTIIASAGGDRITDVDSAPSKESRSHRSTTPTVLGNTRPTAAALGLRSARSPMAALSCLPIPPMTAFDSCPTPITSATLRSISVPGIRPMAIPRAQQA